MKAMRTMVLRGSSIVASQEKQLASVREENKKLKYQIKHLKQSLEEEEK